MKKFCLLFSSLFIFLCCFICFSNKSYANELHETGYKRIEILRSPGENQSKVVANSTDSDLIMFKLNNAIYITTCDYLFNSTHTNYTITFYSYVEDFTGSDYFNKEYDGYTGFIPSSQNRTYDYFPITNSGQSYNLVQGVIFKDLSSAENYVRYGTLENDSIIGGDFEYEVNWGNGIPYMDGSIPSQSIPAPKFNVSGGQSGNITKNITFLNFEYDSRAQDGKYGLVLYMKWASVNDFYLAHTGGAFADTYKVTYGQTLPWGDYVFVYDVPETESQVNYCPQSFSFTSNQSCVNGFQHYLTNYPISSRSIQGPNEMNSITGIGPIESFSDYLSKPECPYNTLIFYCYYYRKMPDGHFEFGPSSTGTFYPPSQNAVFNMNSKTSNDQGSMNSGYGGGASGESDDPFNNGNNWNQQWGDNTPNIDYGQHADPQALVNNISDLFGLIGQMPSFMGQLFVFLPTWLINFISVSIALSIAIGVVKLFIG